MLLAWVRGPEFCQRWAGGQLKFPLDRNQLLKRFATAQGEKPIRLIFKAIDVRTGNMLGYVEIGSIDRLQRRARLELPLVDPAASERGRLGVLLLQKAMEKALGELGLMEIRVSCGSRQSELALCSKRVSGDKHRLLYVLERSRRRDRVQEGLRQDVAHAPATVRIVEGQVQSTEY